MRRKDKNLKNNKIAVYFALAWNTLLLQVVMACLQKKRESFQKLQKFYYFPSKKIFSKEKNSIQ